MTWADFANCGKAYWSPRLAHATGHWIMPRKHILSRATWKTLESLSPSPKSRTAGWGAAGGPHWWACWGQVAGEDHLTLRDILVTCTKWWKCHFLAWRAHTPNYPWKDPGTKAQEQRGQSRGQDRSRSYFKATCNGRNIPACKSEPNETPKPLNINKYQSTAFILGTRWMKP